MAERNFSRRTLLGTGAAAGLVWTTPAIKSLRAGVAVGTPVQPTTPTSGTSPTQTHFDFAGPVTERPLTGIPTPPCRPVFVSFTAELSTLGRTTGSFNTCFEGTFVELSDVPFGLSAEDGTLQGTGSGTGRVTLVSMVSGTFVFTFDLQVSITGGTGAYEGANGSAVYHDEYDFIFGEDPNFPQLIFSGELTGSFDVPA